LEEIIYTIAFKLTSSCFTVRAVKPFLSKESLKMIYFSYFHSKMTYESVFWGNTYQRNTVFKLQKKIIRIRVGIRDRESCTEYFRKLIVVPLQSHLSVYQKDAHYAGIKVFNRLPAPIKQLFHDNNKI
jgi:hypothetical protein